ncbi:MAG: hypothetical protein ACKVX7_00785 [Planctomycetota bacterium]
MQSSQKSKGRPPRRARRLLRALGVALVVTLSMLASDALATRAPTDNSPAFKEAWDLYQAGKPALAKFEQIVADEKAPKKERFNSAYVLAVLELARENADAALKHLDRADDLVASRPQVATRRGEALILKKDLKGAAKVLKAAAAGVKSAKSAELSFTHGLALTRLEIAAGENDAARQRLEALARQRLERWESYFQIALLYEKLDDPKPAISNYAEVLKRDPGKDPFAGIYAYQRHAALSVASDPGSYGKKQLLTEAKKNYEIFLKRAEANGVASNLVAVTTNAVEGIKMFLGGG